MHRVIESGADFSYNVNPTAYPVSTLEVGQEFFLTTDTTMSHIGVVTGGTQTGGAGVNYFTVAGDLTQLFATGYSFNIANSTGNDGTYTVTSSSYSAGTTTIIVDEAIPNATFDGDFEYVNALSYWKGHYIWDGIRWMSKPSSSGDNYHFAGWNDVLAPGLTLNTGNPSVDPTLTVFRTPIELPAFSGTALNRAFTSIHLLHDYIPGTDLFPHIHWSHITASPTGSQTVIWQIDYSIARGYDIDTFPASTSMQLTTTMAAHPQYSHVITETEDSDNGGVLAIDGSTFDVDTVIIFRIARRGDLDTFPDDVFLLYVDMHYQSDGSLTPERNAPFTKFN